MMRRNAMLCTSVALTIGVVAGVAQLGSALRRPLAPLALDKTTHNFGVVIPGCVLRTTFDARNTSSDPLIIEKISSSCGCITHGATLTAVPPGQSLSIPIEIDTSGHSAPANLAKAIVVTAEQSGRRHSVRMAIRAQLRPPIVHSPSRVIFKPSEDGANFLGNFTISRDGLDKNSFQSLVVLSESESYQASIKHRGDDAIAVDLQIPSAHVRPQEASIRVRYEVLGKQRILDVPYEVVAGQLIRAEPSSVVATVAPDSTVWNTVQLVPSGVGVEICEVSILDKTDLANFSWRTDPEFPGRFSFAFDVVGHGEPVLATELVVRCARIDNSSTTDRVRIPLYVVSTESGGLMSNGQ